MYFSAACHIKPQCKQGWFTSCSWPTGYLCEDVIQQLSLLGEHDNNTLDVPQVGAPSAAGLHRLPAIGNAGQTLELRLQPVQQQTRIGVAYGTSE
jgi:hypothetical protein